MKFNMMHTSEGRSTIVILNADGDPLTVTDSHPNYLRIAEALLRDEDPSEWLSASEARDWFTDQFEDDDFEDDDEDYDDDFEVAPVVENLSDTIERYRREGRDPENLVRFMRRLAKNPSKRSRDQLFQWTQAKDMTVDPDGYLIGYKSVTADMLSHTSGTALVNGVETTGRIPNLIGTVISMPRSEVQDDPTIGCSTGLHVGSWNYARSFGGHGSVILEVRVDPSDVVSVPTDCGFQKLRCSEYEVIAIHDSNVDDLTNYEPESSWSADDAFDSFVNYVPQSFLNRLRDRVLRRDRDGG